MKFIEISDNSILRDFELAEIFRSCKAWILRIPTDGRVVGLST